MIQALGLKEKVKIADDLEETPYTVLDVLVEDIPVYIVSREDGNGHIKTLHQNKLLPFTCLPSEPLLDAPRDSGTLQSNHLSSDSHSDTDSDSSEIADSEQSEGGDSSVNKCSIHIRKVPGDPALHPRKQQPCRPQCARKPAE